MPRQRQGTVPIFSCSGSNRIIRRVGRGEAVRLIEGGSMDMITSGRGKGTELAALKMKELERESGDSAASITPSEMFTNAMVEAGYKASKIDRVTGEEKIFRRKAGFVRAVCDKIQEWPKASLRNKSVTVVPRAAFV
jgi:hypothetical protein